MSLNDTVQMDDRGNLFAEVTIDGTVLTDADVENLQARGISVDTESATNNFYIALDPSDGAIEAAGGTGDATNLNFDLDADDIDFRTLSQGSTTDPLSTLDAALNQIDSLRSELGAITNLTAARSRIEDADMTRAQILQQANQIPQNVLSLLG